MSDDDTKIGRTVRLTPSVNRRLLALCDHLGVNPNAYLVQVVGAAISRDEVSFNAKLQTDSIFQHLQEVIDREASGGG